MKKNTSPTQTHLGEFSPRTNSDKTSFSLKAWQLIEGLVTYESTPSALTKIYPILFVCIISIVILCIINPDLTIFALIIFSLIITGVILIVVFKPDRAIVIDGRTAPYGDKESNVIDGEADYTNEPVSITEKGGSKNE